MHSGGPVAVCQYRRIQYCRLVLFSLIVAPARRLMVVKVNRVMAVVGALVIHGGQ